MKSLNANRLQRKALSARLALLGMLGAVGTAIALLGGVGSAAAAPMLRFSTDQRGDVVMFGNTGGFDCRTMNASPDPVVGSLDRANCGRSTEDSSPDMFWRSDMPTDGKASADPVTLPADARTTGVLQLPTGATVTYARIYWSSSLNEGYLPSTTIVIDRPGAGGFKEISVTADPKDVVRDSGGSSLVFQASADISSILRTYGPGAYRIRGYATSPLVDLGQDVAWVGWGALVAYRNDADPIRNITIFDGLTRVGPDAEVAQPISGFVVPPSGSPEGKMLLLAYEGDAEKTGDSLLWNGTAISDDQNPADNFFNSSRSKLGQAVSVAGDLPQLSGVANSMASMDMDTVNVTPLLMPGATSANVSIKVTSDVVYLGMMATSIRSKKPILETTLTYPPNAGTRQGDVIEFTSTTKNTGDDTAAGVVIVHKLPDGLEYVPGSARVTGGPNQGPKTDALADDQVDYDPATRTLTIRLGAGANGTAGGTISPQDMPNVVKYQLRVADTAHPGDIPTQSTATATPAGAPTAPAVSYPSGNGMTPGAPTIVRVPECSSNSDCAAGAPVCDLSTAPHHCVNFCKSDADCKGAAGGLNVCDQDSRTCVQCTNTSKSACRPLDGGAMCIMGAGRCGCTSDADCGGRKCDLATNRCPKPDADLAVHVVVSPDPASVDEPINYDITVSNKGPGTAPPGVVVTYDVPAGGVIDKVIPGDGWRCTISDRTVRCSQLGPIGPSTTTPPVRIVVRPQVGDAGGAGGDASPTLQAKVGVTSDVSNDPNPADNSVNVTTELGRYKSAGGGFSCAVASARSTAGLLGWAGMALSLLLLSRALRRRARGRA